MHDSLSKLSDSIGISDDIPRTLHDQLGVKETSELAHYPLRMLGAMFPELDRGQLYDFGKAARLPEFNGSQPSPADSEVSAQSGDEFNNAAILQLIPPYHHKVDDQGSTNGSCGAFATSALLEFCLARAGRLPTGARISRAFNYIVGSMTDGHVLSWLFGNDYGVMPDAVGRVIAGAGYLYDQELPYDAGFDYFNKNDKTPILKPHSVKQYQYLPTHYQMALKRRPAGLQMTTLHPFNPADSVTSKIDSYLRRGYPSVYGFRVPQEMGWGDGSGIMPRQDGDAGGSHAVMIIGKLVDWSPPGTHHPRTNWYIHRNWGDPRFGAKHPIPQYQQKQSCGLISEHDVYWRHVQSLHFSWQ